MRDLLTMLSRGTVGESLTAPPRATARSLPTSSRTGRYAASPISKASSARSSGRSACRFTTADFELVSTPATRGHGRDQVPREGPAAAAGLGADRQLLPGARRPASRSPTSTWARYVGRCSRRSATSSRSCTSSCSIYNSAFLETAEGSSLDKVVALVGVRRLPVGHPVASCGSRGGRARQDGSRSRPGTV